MINLTDALHALGTQLKMNATKIAKVTNISGPGMSVDMEDVTSHDNEDKWEELIPTIKRSGEISLDILYVPDEHGAIITALDKDIDDPEYEAESFEMIFPDAEEEANRTTWEFDGWVTGFESEGPVEGALRASMTVKVTGTPDFSPGGE